MMSKRNRNTKTLLTPKFYWPGVFVSFFLISACNDITDIGTQSHSRAQTSNLTGTNKAYIYPDNPVALHGKTISYADFAGHLVARFITADNYLEANCNFTQYSPDIFSSSQNIPFTDTTANKCVRVLNDSKTTTEILSPKNESWAFQTGSDEFYQVNTFYHIKSLYDRFLESLSFAHEYVHLKSNLTIPPATKYNLVDTQSYLLTKQGLSQTLTAYSKCALESNAYFSPAEDILCFGHDGKNFLLVQDPSVIYHEVGHALVKAMMNQRNVTSGIDPMTSSHYFQATTYQSDLGEIFYDEAGAINEAIADYFSYYMNKRTKVAEFAFNKIIGGYRPLAEDEEVHSADVSTAPGERLSYPDFVHYDPLNPDKNIEDIHYSSAIISHYFVALTKSFKQTCSYPTTNSDEIHKKATDYVMLLINETLAEIGDLTAKGSDLFSQYATLNTAQQNVYFTNLNPEQSFLWTQVVNPPSFRRFFQIFGKNIYHYISSGLCPNFNLDDSEQLLDEYGLLLFKSYEDRGNGLNSQSFSANLYSLYTGESVFSGKNFMPFVLNTQVNENNRKKSILISKNFIKLDEESIAYIIDGQNDIKNILAELTFEGENVSTTQGIAGAEYNNNNIKISPGEVIALSLNLFNNSNSVMGGVQFLANDWDHMKLNDGSQLYTNTSTNMNGLNTNKISGAIASHSPCIIDDFPLASEGGVKDTSTTTPGNCSYITKTNTQIDSSEVVSGVTYPKYDLDAPQPICMVQYSDEDETKWVSQDFYRNYALNLEDKDCLNNPSMSANNFNPNECLIRFLPGASQAVLGKINPQSTWAETIRGESSDFTFDAGQLTLMEVNKWIRPGTKFNCRFRVRFSNCSDCYDDFQTGDPITSLSDYSDFEYAGHNPYKVINFQFTVLD